MTCDMWLQALAALATWDDGVDGTLLFHLLFSGARDDPAAKGRRRCASVAARAYPLWHLREPRPPLVGCGPQADE